MTSLEVYLIAAPLVLLVTAAAGAYWFLHRPYPESSKRKSR